MADAELTVAQEMTLRALCKHYKISFVREEFQPDLTGSVCRQVGPIYVCCDPFGRLSEPEGELMDLNGQDDLKVTRLSHEEGADKGFVYFNDGSRVGFAPLREVALWDAGGDKWSKASARHLVMAQDYLEAHGIEFPPVQPTKAAHVVDEAEDMTVGELIKLLQGCDQKSKIQFIDVDARERRIANVENGDPVCIYESTE